MAKTRKTNEVRIEGMPLLTRRLRTLEAKLQKKIVRQAIRKALKPILADAKNESPKKSGTLRKSLKIKSFKRSRAKLGARITTGKTTGNFEKKGFYGAFNNYGAQGKKGRRWLNRVAKQNKSKARKTFRDHVRAEIKSHR